MSTTNELGRRGERIAAAYLTRAGARVLDRNWTCREGSYWSSARHPVGTRQAGRGQVSYRQDRRLERTQDLAAGRLAPYAPR